MSLDFLTIITFLYICSGLVNIWGYMPTVIDLLQEKPSANPHSYELWMGTSTSSTLYAVYIVHDNLLIVLSLINVLFCGLIVFLRFRIKKKHWWEKVFHKKA